MPGIFKILIVDSNYFFSEGLALSIERYFIELNIPVIIMKNRNSYRMADLIFWAPDTPDAAFPPGLVGERSYMSKLVLVMVQHGAELTQQRVPFFLYRHQKIDVVYDIIDNAITAKCNEEFVIPQKALMDKLTFRQRQTLHYLSKGIPIKQVANLLRVDYKTISSHKRSAMVKLGIRRTTELHQLLLVDY